MQRNLPDQRPQPLLLHMTLGQADHKPLVDAIEEIGDVRFQEGSWPRPVTGDGAGEARDPAQAVMSSAAGNAGITVPDEAPVETVGNRVLDEVVHDPVPEIRCPDFPDFRVRHDKSDAASDTVLPTRQVAI